MQIKAHEQMLLCSQNVSNVSKRESSKSVFGSALVHTHTQTHSINMLTDTLINKPNGLTFASLTGCSDREKSAIGKRRG